MNIIYIISALVIGLGAGYLIRKTLASQSINSAEQKAEHLIAQAKDQEKTLLLEAKEKAIKIIDEAKAEEKDRREDLKQAQQRIEQRESKFDQKLLDLEEKQNSLTQKSTELEAAKEKITKIQEEQLIKLETIAGFSREKAEEVLLKNTEKIYKDSLLSRMKKLEEENALELEKRAKDKLAQVIARIAVSHASETTTTAVDLPNEEMKGRIIGKEGRNIRAIELLTGCELIVDDTPNVITVSSFSPIRRHVAKRSLEALIVDGRIQPSRIEDAVDQAKKNIALEIKKSGEDALYEAGIASGIDPKLVQLLGRMRFRTSYGQNVLQHSIEVSLIAGTLAEELKANVQVCKIGGLFHDIGKAVDHEIKGGHPEIGYDIMKKFGLSEEIAYLSIAHHEDNPATLEGHICKIADAISGGRPGARKDTLQNYIQRLQELEAVAGSFEGIDKVYAIRAGREVRVFVNPQQMDDLTAARLAKDIATKIESELNYPGEIKVTLIRENRITEFAR